jgi:DNA-binding CsgD family transcriptional regulator
MPLSSLLVYLLSLAAVTAACWQAQNLAKTFRLYFLSSYLGFLVAVGIAFILNLVATDLSTEVLRDIPPQGMDPIYILFGLVVFPLYAIAWYFALVFAAGILDEELSSSFRIAYILVWTILFGMFLTRIQFALRKQSLPPLVRNLNLGLGLVLGLIPIAVYAYLIARAGRRPRTEDRTGLVRFGAVSLACYFLMIAAMAVTPSGPPLRWAAPALIGLAMLSPLYVLKAHLARFYRPIPAGTFEGPKLGGLCDRYGLSTREREILALLLRGKSNKEIERDLFISPHTVRNHIHNIYQKLGVGSRLQLLNFVRERLE